MPIKFVEGDLLATNGLSALAHGCNCQGAMGSGIAIGFKERFPEMFETYLRMCTTGSFAPGSCYMYFDTSTKDIVFNLATQNRFTGPERAKLEWIRESMTDMLRIAKEKKLSTIGLPRVGAGLGGLVWENVKALMEELADTTTTILVVFEEYVPNKSATF